MSERDIKILMIDDEEQILFALRAVFQFQGWASISAKDVPTGLELFRTQHPDLVLIDGGPVQLQFAREAMLQAGANVPMFGLAERLEEIFLPGQEESILLDHHTPELHLIQRIRDEAHRFAITHHRGLRGKQSVHSALEDIPGVGPARRRALLQCFKTVKAIREASVDALKAVPGMSAPAAQAVYAWAHPAGNEE